MENFQLIIGVSIKGSRPLLQNDSFDEEKPRPGQHYDPQEEAEKRLILNGDTICQKATHLEGCMIKSAADFKFSGRKTYKEGFKAAVTVEPLFIPHLKPEWVIDSQSVRIGKARIMRSRPRFDDWALDFQIICKDQRIQPVVIKEILENAGQNVGIGDYRPRYGLFEITKFDVNGKDNL